VQKHTNSERILIYTQTEKENTLMKFQLPIMTLGILLLAVSFCFGHGDREVAEDQVTVNATGYWIYNDLDKGYAQAAETGHPMLVVFR